MVGILNPTLGLRSSCTIYDPVDDAIYAATATYDATTRHGTSASLFTASFHWPHLLKMPKRSSSHGPLAQLRGHCHWPRQGEDQPSLITPPSVVKTTVGARGVEQIVWNFSEAVRVSLYPCPNLLARSRASNHEQGHAAPSSHTDA
jgi:hypothetical protein